MPCPGDWPRATPCELPGTGKRSESQGAQGAADPSPRPWGSPGGAQMLVLLTEWVGVVVKAELSHP